MCECVLQPAEYTLVLLLDGHLAVLAAGLRQLTEQVPLVIVQAAGGLHQQRNAEVSPSGTAQPWVRLVR